MLPGSAQTVSDLSGSAVAAKLAAKQTSKVTRRVVLTVFLRIADLLERVLTVLFAVTSSPTNVMKIAWATDFHRMPVYQLKKTPVAFATGYLSTAILRYMPPILKVYNVPPCGIEERLAALAIAVAPMAPNLSLRSRPAVTGRPIQPPMPDHTDTYCLPFTEYVIGLPMTPEPSLRDHSTLPVARSTARKSPPRLP